MRRLFLRLLGLAACVSGGGLAASGCTSVYALNSTSINWVNAQSGVVTSSYTTGFTNINGVALNPLTGELYFIDRSTATTNTLYRYNPQNISTAPVQVAAINRPVRALEGTNVTGTLIGATFNNSPTSPKLFLLYTNYVVQEVNPSTGAQVRTFNLNLSNGAQNTTTATSTTTQSNGDIVFVGDNLYAILDGEQGGTSGMFYANFGAVADSGVTLLNSSSVVRLSLGGTNVARQAYNGISYDPVTVRTLISSGSGTALLNTTSGAVTALGTSANLTDMTGCGNTPDAPTITKSFNPSTIFVNQNSRVTLTIGNTNPSPYYLQSALTDTLQTGLTVATTPTVSTTCTASDGSAVTVTATAGGNTVSLPTGTRIPGGGCTLSFNVTASSAAGSRVNTIAAGDVVSTAGNNAAAGTATLTVNNAITGTVVKRQRNVTQSGTLGTAAVSAKPKDVIEYCLTATHAGTGYADATVATLRDLIPSPLVPQTNGYGTGQDVRITRNGGTSYTYATLASDTDAATYTSGTRTLTVNILPFAAGATVEACFQAQVP